MTKLSPREGGDLHRAHLVEVGCSHRCFQLLVQLPFHSEIPLLQPLAATYQAVIYHCEYTTRNWQNWLGRGVRMLGKERTSAEKPAVHKSHYDSPLNFVNNSHHSASLASYVQQESAASTQVNYTVLLRL